MSDIIKRITIEGFKSIRTLENFELRSLNVLIGANGAGKSNFVGFFRLLRDLIDRKLRLAVEVEGGADRCLYLGPKVTPRLAAELYFGHGGYDFGLRPTVDNRFVFEYEGITSETYDGVTSRENLASGHDESRLMERAANERKGELPPPLGEPGLAPYVFEAVSTWVVYHFHDTSLLAGVRRQGAINDNESLRPNADNLAAFLHRVRQTTPQNYAKIRDVVRLAAPFFDDFKLRPVATNLDLIQLEWLQKDSDYPFLASQLSDGLLRFICLATALLQPSLPSTVLFDEPELGLHPFALTLLANLFQQVANQYGKQVIVSTQSAPLLNHFAPEDVIVVEREQGQSTFRRLESAALSEWLGEYQLGELWQKNVLGGRPRSEEPRQSPSDTIDASQAPQGDASSAEDKRP